MKLNILKSKIEGLSDVKRILFIMLSASWVINIVLATVVVIAFTHQRVVIIPATVDKPFSISESGIDASYLEQMAIFFVSARFDVTPENITSQQQTLLEYTDSGFYHTVSDVLDQEAKVIKKDDISSVFFLSKAPLVDTNRMMVKITGTLKKWVGDRALQDEHKTYLIYFSYHNGELRIKDVEESNNDY